MMHDHNLLNLAQHLNQRERSYHALLSCPAPAVADHERFVDVHIEVVFWAAARVAAGYYACAGAGADDHVGGVGWGGDITGITRGEVVGGVRGGVVVAFAHFGERRGMVTEDEGSKKRLWLERKVGRLWGIDL
jgi:hypothetical protein